MNTTSRKGSSNSRRAILIYHVHQSKCVNSHRGCYRGNVRGPLLIRSWLGLYQAALVAVAIFALQGCEETTTPCQREAIGACYEQATINSATVCGESLLVFS